MEKIKDEIDAIDDIDLTKFDFSKAKKNPYAKFFNKQVTINLRIQVIDYFKDKAARSGIPYQTLINSYLLDCAINDKLKIPCIEDED